MKFKNVLSFQRLPEAQKNIFWPKIILGTKIWKVLKQFIKKSGSRNFSLVQFWVRKIEKLRNMRFDGPINDGSDAFSPKGYIFVVDLYLYLHYLSKNLGAILKILRKFKGNFHFRPCQKNFFNVLKIIIEPSHRIRLFLRLRKMV